MISNGTSTHTGACSTPNGTYSTNSSIPSTNGNTGTAMSPSQAPITPSISEILACYRGLSKLATLDPSPQVDALFGRLVYLCRQTPDNATAAKILKDERIVDIVPHLRQLCADGEYRLEAYWVKKIIGFKTQVEVNNMLQNFTYYSNYVDLIRMELNAISSVSNPSAPPRKFAILGSGPLPLTSLCIHETLAKEDSNISIHNIDYDQWAISTSQELCRKLGYSASTMNFRCMDAKSKKLELVEFDVVYLAALVGMNTQAKNDVVLDIVSKMRPGALLMLRSAHSLRGLLYPVVDLTENMANMGLQPLLVVHPYNHIINSIIVARVGFPIASGACRL